MKPTDEPGAAVGSPRGKGDGDDHVAEEDGGERGQEEQGDGEEKDEEDEEEEEEDSDDDIEFITDRSTLVSPMYEQIFSVSRC